MRIYRAWKVAVLLSGLFLAPSLAQPAGLPGPSINTPAAAPPPPVQPALVAPLGATDENYRLGTGDKLKVTVYQEPDLSGEMFVDGSGQVQMPLLGQVKAAGLSVHEFVNAVQAILGQKYLRDPRVSVEILNYRPFYIMGEVNKPGEYPFENGLNVLGAIALAGGFSNRANDNEVIIRRSGDVKEVRMPANTSTKINPGDVVRVPERFF